MQLPYLDKDGIEEDTICQECRKTIIKANAPAVCEDEASDYPTDEYITFRYCLKCGIEKLNTAHADIELVIAEVYGIFREQEMEK